MKNRYKVIVTYKGNTKNIEFFVTCEDTEEIIKNNFIKSFSELLNTEKENIDIRLEKIETYE